MNKKDREASKKHGIETAFYAWCKQKGVDPNPDSFIKFDEEKGLKLLDYEAAKREGYYSHLRMQAAKIIASWTRVVFIEPKPRTTPSVLLSRPVPPRPVSRQDRYDIDGVSVKVEEIMKNEEHLFKIITQFKTYILNKSERLSYFIDGHKNLTEKQQRASAFISAVALDAIEGLEKAEKILKS